jgi:hypothetical protein
VVVTAAAAPVFLAEGRISCVEGGLFVATYVGDVAWLLVTRT